MASDDAILGKMRAARVQPHAFNYTLKDINKAFAQIIKDKRFDQGVGGLVSYMVVSKKPRTHPTSAAALACHVAAKELVLLGQKVFCTSLPELVLALAKTEDDAIEFRIGKGYFVVSDLGENTKHCTLFQWDAAQATLLSHISRGGGLILGTSDISAIDFGEDFLSALPAFEQIAIA